MDESVDNDVKILNASAVVAYTGLQVAMKLFDNHPEPCGELDGAVGSAEEFGFLTVSACRVAASNGSVVKFYVAHRIYMQAHGLTRSMFQEESETLEIIWRELNDRTKLRYLIFFGIIKTFVDGFISINRLKLS